jgi:hypothetical protein
MATPATIARAIQEIAKLKVTEETLRGHLDEGFFASLMKSNPANINRADFQRACGLNPHIYTVDVNYDPPFQDLIRIGRFDYVNPTVMDYYQVPPSVSAGTERIQIELISFGREIGVVSARQGLLQINYRPVTLYELVSLGVQYPTAQLEGHIACVDSGVDPDFAICLFGYHHQRRLGVNDGYFSPSFRFAAVKIH